MIQSATNHCSKLLIDPRLMEKVVAPGEFQTVHSQVFARLRPLWDRRRFLFRFTEASFLITILVSFLISKCYQSTSYFMPVDSQSSSDPVVPVWYEEWNYPILANRLQFNIMTSIGLVLLPLGERR
jgi:hypothetical protein